MSKSNGPKFKFRTNVNVGAPDAEQDTQYLTTCFVDIGLAQTLLDTADPRCLIIGRTGSGKTALIQHLKSNGQQALHTNSPFRPNLCAGTGIYVQVGLVTGEQSYGGTNRRDHSGDTGDPCRRL
jgi:hypothetical protein